MDKEMNGYDKIILGFKSILAGTGAGMTGKLLEYPLDTIKVRLQTSSDGFKGPLDCLIKTVKFEGFSALYKGLPSPLMGAMLESALLFVTYEQAKLIILKFSKNPTDQLTPVQSFIVGGCSGFGSTLVLTPVELIKVRLQIQQNAVGKVAKYSGVFDCARQTLRKSGIKGLYQGIGSTLMREAIGNAFWFSSYDLCCKLLIPPNKTRKDVGSWVFIFSGAIAGALYWAIPFPIDTIKSRIQGNSTEKKSVMNIAKEIMKESGIKGFYRGLGITVFRAIPANAAIFFVYEHISRFIGIKR